MVEESEFIVRAASPEETRKLGSQLGKLLSPGDVVLLSGTLGAGKTQFVQGVARGLSADEVPVSPTFNIVLTYPRARLALHHFDLYRLEDADQLDDIALREYLEGDGVCFVEWAEKFPEAFDGHLAIDIRKVSDTEREFHVSAVGARADRLLGAWRAAVSASDEGRFSPASCSADAPDPVEEGSPRSSMEDARVPSAMRAQNVELDTRAAFVQVSGDESLVLAFDTANEIVALGVGALERATRRVRPVASREIAAHRASNTTLVPAIDRLLEELGANRSQIACVCVGRGPGSFTGVRIAMACAKGMASALGIALVGVSTLDAIAWNCQASGVRGSLLVVADAMRKEVYPARFALSEDHVERLTSDYVVKAEAFAAELSFEKGARDPSSAGRVIAEESLQLVGDGLVKYRALFEGAAQVLSDKLWEVTGRGLLYALQDAWAAGRVDPFDAKRHDPGLALPVYTRLSDAEENERAKLAHGDARNLRSGVQDIAPDGGKGRATMHSQAKLAAVPDDAGVSYRPLDAAHVGAVARLEKEAMGTDAWGERLVADELGWRNRSWWVAEAAGNLVGYAGGLVVDGDLQVLKVAVAPAWRRQGIARELVVRMAEDARNLGAATCSLEVRLSNAQAQAFYESLGLASVGTRPRYYSDREDAVIMKGPLPQPAHDVGGMRLLHLPSERRVDRLGDGAASVSSRSHDCGQGGWEPGRAQGLTAAQASSSSEGPASGLRLLAIESSCDETAGAVIDGDGRLLSDVVASQIDFHARFGGVVPEIASRKHIEAICGVCDEALEGAHTRWSELDAVAVTYAPGLLGALVVGVAFAKGAAWALDVPLVFVNHLEGHLYANKIDCPEFEPPALVSLVSGGNTLLVHMRGWGDYETLGETIDDAVGEAFDKVAKALGLGYPGGPAISKLAAQGDPSAIAFPRPLLHSHDLRFSLSGLKTAVVNYLQGERESGRELNLADIAASFQQAVVDVQVAKVKAALEQTGAPVLCLGGGVAANPALRSALERLCAKQGVRLVMPPLASCGDNAGMIALAALDRYRDGKFAALSADAQAHTTLDAPY